MRTVDIIHLPVDLVVAVFRDVKRDAAWATFYIDSIARSSELTTLGEMFEPVRRTPWRPAGLTETDFARGAAAALRHRLVELDDKDDCRFIGVPAVDGILDNVRVRAVPIHEPELAEAA